MRPKTLILMVVAVGCGLGAALATSQYAKKPADTGAKEEETYAVMVAQRDLRAYTNLKDAKMLFREEYKTKGEIPKGAVSDFKTIEGRSLKADVKKDDILVEGDIMTVDQAGITAKLNDGERAFTAKVTPITGTGGFIRPGDRVDVIGSQPQSQRGEPFSKTILQDIEVLAIDIQLQAQEGVVNKPVDHVTLRLTPPQVEMLSVYTDAGVGTLRLVPRRHGDLKQVATTGETASGTKTKGNRGSGEPVDVPTPPPSSGSSSQLLPPSVPDLPPSEVAKEDPKKKVHTMTIVDGPNSARKFQFELADKEESQ